MQNFETAQPKQLKLQEVAEKNRNSIKRRSPHQLKKIKTMTAPLALLLEPSPDGIIRHPLNLDPVRSTKPDNKINVLRVECHCYYRCSRGLFIRMSGW